ncbi:MAG: hypothetical protein Q4G22_14620, partial [Paracoccus sp. (in: a-proteobacteria)]|uniref:hypothetical protein n=1 Tax=Paracoccus sp. TaxID=267 RepID=UPI0026DFC297
MNDLTPTQTAVLNSASARPRQIALPLPGHLPAGAQAKVVAALLLRGLLTEAAPAPGDPLWRDTGRTLVLSSAGMEAIGFDPVVIRAVAGQKGSRKASSRPEPQPTETPSQADLPPTHKASVANAPAQADGAKAPEDRATTAKATSIAAHTTEPAAPDRARSPRTGTKQATLIAMLRAPD